MVHEYTKVTATAVPTVTIVSGGKLTLKELQKHVGGFIQIIALKGDLLMVVDEDGLSKGLPKNNHASDLAGQDIVGTVLVCDIDSID